MQTIPADIKTQQCMLEQVISDMEQNTNGPTFIKNVTRLYKLCNDIQRSYGTASIIGNDYVRAVLNDKANELMLIHHFYDPKLKKYFRKTALKEIRLWAKAI